MARVKIDSVSKRYGDVTVLDNVSIDVTDGEFLAVLGPSGCGKTTLLRLIAGFERISQGSIDISGKTVSSLDRHVQPEHREVGIVFQSYALWPHMSVAANVGYSLRVRRVRSEVKRETVKEALAVVGLSGFEDRSPAELSGGQRQRVALARCLVQAPKLVLLDEPLANLDVHLRASMEDEFADFHRRSGSTMIYITHDQSEAMALADRIAVMDAGRIEQIATPQELHNKPASSMIAKFIGGGMVIDGTVQAAVDDTHSIVDVFGTNVNARCNRRRPPGESVKLAVYPSALEPAHAGSPGIACHVVRSIYQGGRYRVEIAPDASPHTRLVLSMDDSHRPIEGDRLVVAISDSWIIPRDETVSI